MARSATHIQGPSEPTHKLKVGAPMWSLPSWVGTVTPSGPKRSDDLAWYASWCNAVEGNTTFYALPSEASIARWLDLAPSDFRFCFKLPRTITHERRLRETSDLVGEFLTRTSPLHERLGPIWIQLPASFAPDDLTVLRRFLGRLPTDFAWSVELRNPAFEASGAAERQANDLLFEANVDRTLIDTRAVFSGPCVTEAEQDAWRKKPRLKVRPLALATHPTVRFIGQTDPEANPAFWLPWVEHVVRWLDEGREPYVFIHTPDNAEAASLARRFYRQVANRVTTLAPLPTPKRSPQQAPLFP